MKLSHIKPSFFMVLGIVTLAVVHIVTSIETILPAKISGTRFFALWFSSLIIFFGFGSLRFKFVRSFVVFDEFLISFEKKYFYLIGFYGCFLFAVVLVRFG
jgi:hypothetical protein